MDRDVSYDPAEHYERVTDSWRYLLGEDLHYGVFDSGDEDLADATSALTKRMIEAADMSPDLDVLDVGCGTGAPACDLAEHHAARVLGITTSETGVRLARERAQRRRLRGAAFERRDGTSNGLPDESFDRVWVLESSHLMRERDRLIQEAARVLRPGGRLVLCDIVLQRDIPFLEVRRLLREFTLLRAVFGDAHMMPLPRYAELIQASGLEVIQQTDLTVATLPTFARWRDNAERNEREVVALVGEDYRQQFVEATDVLEAFWKDGTLGYGLVAAARA
jgi:cyclopropane fatty-acyl-phospholipid synthase-like methyltransferase